MGSTRFLKTAICVLFIGVSVSACSAISSPPNLRMAVQSAIHGSGNVNVSVYKNVATLSGYVDDNISKFSVERAARKVHGIEGVINLISTAI